MEVLSGPFLVTTTQLFAKERCSDVSLHLVDSLP
jgi:hypothetical protein